MLAILLIASKWFGLAGMAFVGVSRWLFPGAFTPDFHFTAGVIASLEFSLAQVMTIYYFYGMRRALVNACARHGLDTEIAAEAESLKRRVAGRGYILALLATATPIAGGGTVFGPIPGWVHYTLGTVTIALGCYTGVTEFRAFHRNARLFDRTASLITACGERSRTAEPAAPVG
ncbi:MAG TPA: hypothetical protein VGB22_05550 [candidate division Zixibacteria bacterium]|jgi:hypothetical protein